MVLSCCLIRQPKDMQTQGCPDSLVSQVPVSTLRDSKKLSLISAQTLLLKEGVLAYVIPLLLGYDTTLEEKEGGQPAFDASTDESQIGPKFLGLGIERSNMQVRISLGLGRLLQHAH